MEKQKYIAPKFTAEYFSKLITQANGKVRIITDDSISKDKTLKRLRKKIEQHARVIALTSSIKRNPEHFAYLNEKVKGFREKLIDQVDLSKKQIEWCQQKRMSIKFGGVGLFDLWETDDYIRYAEELYK